MTPAATLKRKNRLGIPYRRIAEMVGVSHETIRLVLTEGPSGLEFDRERILRETIAALDKIEAEQAEHA